MQIKKRLFELGRVVATPGALDLLEAHGQTLQQMLARHSTGDWGALCEEDAQMNVTGVQYGFRIMSVYPLHGADCVWLITESDRSVTTLLLPEEY